MIYLNYLGVILFNYIVFNFTPLITNVTPVGNTLVIHIIILFQAEIDLETINVATRGVKA